MHQGQPKSMGCPCSGRGRWSQEGKKGKASYFNKEHLFACNPLPHSAEHLSRSPTFSGAAQLMEVGGGVSEWPC